MCHDYISQAVYVTFLIAHETNRTVLKHTFSTPLALTLAKQFGFLGAWEQYSWLSRVHPKGFFQKRTATASFPGIAINLS